MKINYDRKVDAAFIQMSLKKPDDGVELAEGVILHTTSNNVIAAMRFLVPVKSFP